MHALLGALLIFSLRIVDVSIGTLRVMYMVRGERGKTVPLAFLESGVWVFAISRIFKQVDNPLNMLAFAAGYAAGTMVGMTLERWIASGYILVRVISGGEAKNVLAEAIRGAGFGVTVLPGEGRGGQQVILFVVALRRRGRELLDLIRRSDDDAFVTVDSVNRAIGGYLPPAGMAAGLRK